MVRLLILALVTIGVASAQEKPLGRVTAQSEYLRQFSWKSGGPLKDLGAFRETSAPLHLAVRDWIESLIPKSKSALDAEVLLLSTRIAADLEHNGLIEKGDDQEGPKPGLLSSPQIAVAKDDPNKLVIIVGAAVPCGYDDVVYIYDYSQGVPRRILESHGTGGHDESVSQVLFSKFSEAGYQQILTIRSGAQCWSTWNEVSYNVFGFSPRMSAARQILEGTHQIWFGDDGPFVRLASDDLLIQMRDRSIDSGIHNRAHVLHYKSTESSAERIDPVALLPQDFADEWLTRPWSEMASRSTAEKREGEDQTKLEKWHKFLGGDFVAGEFTLVQACSEKRNVWQIGIDLDWIQGKDIPEPLSVYFLVRQLDGPHRYQMTDVSFNRQEGCPGDSRASLDKPTLFPENE